jgi:enoyl-CoA hydratase/carnithine racemase
MDDVRVSVDGPVRTITLNRPAKRNALTRQMLSVMEDALTPDPPAAERVTVLRAEGSAFSAGLDLRERLADTGPDDEGPIDRVLAAISAYPLPVVAAVQGDALAGGNTLALQCDVVVAVETARFGMPLARIGLAPTWLIGRNLVAVAGPVVARDILLTGEPVAATRLASLGVIARAVPAAEFAAEVDRLVERISANAPLSLRAMKALVARASGADDLTPHDEIDDLMAATRSSDDAREGVSAWLDGRRAEFRGR